MKYVFSRHARPSKYLKRAFVLADHLGFLLLLLVGLLLVGVALWLGKGAL